MTGSAKFVKQLEFMDYSLSAQHLKILRQLPDAVRPYVQVFCSGIKFYEK